MMIHECQQSTPDWWKVRCGVPSASNFSKIVTPAKGELSKSRVKYIDELIADRIIGMPEDVGAYMSRSMENGVNMEPLARQWYRENQTDLWSESVKEVGFITDDCGWYGCSPDALIYRGDDIAGGLELKCPMLKTHIGYLRMGSLPLEYKLQVHGSLAVTGLPWWDFMSFCEGVPPFLIRVKPDEFTHRLGTALRAFVVEYQNERDRVSAMIPEPPSRPRKN